MKFEYMVYEIFDGTEKLIAGLASQRDIEPVVTRAAAQILATNFIVVINVNNGTIYQVAPGTFK